MQMQMQVHAFEVLRMEYYYLRLVPLAVYWLREKHRKKDRKGKEKERMMSRPMMLAMISFHAYRQHVYLSASANKQTNLIQIKLVVSHDDDDELRGSGACACKQSRTNTIIASPQTCSYSFIQSLIQLGD